MTNTDTNANAEMKYAMHIGYSDVQPYEIIRHVSAKTIEVRPMKATLLNGFKSGEPDALQFSPGGFCGHTSGVQRYSFESNPAATVSRIRLSKKGWKSASGFRFKLGTAPYKHYDYNF